MGFKYHLVVVSTLIHKFYMEWENGDYLEQSGKGFVNEAETAE